MHHLHISRCQSIFWVYGHNVTNKFTIVFVNNVLGDISTSLILKGEPESFLQQLKQWFSFTKLSYCWRASFDGWNSRIFHSKCDYRGKTITLVKVGRYIFGGYSTNQWGGSSGSYRTSSSNYIFSLRNKDNLSPFRSDVYQNSNNAIYTDPDYGPTFGGGHDIHIASNANKNTNSYTNFGHTYRPPSGYSYTSSNTRALLAGSYTFTPDEVEVYYYA
ncbi:uncharacterized protein LOC124435855 [Xenia sp. Carnegie-2017]|uniref:uncharacterized protein LOC124435855 n=1 Tax=Xenia sp. Carnegie-2017 TaxID=2897299 RepID=UPI001F049B0B|nr:uncharacterized protein LOC124435855 [Xenia sp. Carnegie-2017]